MKYKGRLVIAIALLLALATPLHAATPKAGAKCTKAGATATTSGKKFTCVKSGSKLVWNKGVAIKKPTPVATASPSPTSSPTPTPAAPVIQRKDWELIYMKIWDEYEKSQTLGKFPFTYKLSPNVNQVRAQESIDAYDKAMKLWLAILNGAAVSPVVWTIMSEKDYAWWKQVVEQQEGTSANYAWNPDSNMLGHCQLSSIAFCGYGNTFKSNTPDYKFLQYNVIGSAYSQSPNANTVNHESVHFYQLSVVQGFPRDTPCWYVEGQASLYGGALQHNLVTERTASTRQRNNFKGIVRQYQPNADSFAAKDWVGVLQNMYSGHVSCSGQQDYFKYAMGMFIWENLYDKYGPKVMHQVLLDFKAGKSFTESIQGQLSVSLEQLNEQLAKYLVFVFAEGN